MSACCQANHRETDTLGFRDKRVSKLKLSNFQLGFRTGILSENFTLAQTFRKSAARVSIARWLAWEEASGKPPILRISPSLVTRRASSTVLPLINSVMADPQAIAGTQPFARKRISAMRVPSSFVFSNLALSSRMSPQIGFSNCALASGASICPALRGC
jgi:hypothetical protein